MTDTYIENLKVGGGAGAGAVGNSPAGGCTIANNGDITTDGTFSPAAIAVGGGYGSTGTTLESDGDVSMNGNLVVDGQVDIGGGSAGGSGLTIDTAGALTLNDNLLLTNAAAAKTLTVRATGGTNTGSVVLSATGAFSTTVSAGTTQGAFNSININNHYWNMVSAAAKQKFIRFFSGTTTTTTNQLRWTMGANATAEGGSSAGSDWELNAYDDDGATTRKPVLVTRATGLVSFLVGLLNLGVAGGANSGKITMVGKTSGSNVIDVTDTAGSIRVGSAGATNSTQWDTTGHQTMIGAAKPWEDLRVEPIARTTGTNAPVFEKYLDDAAGTSRGVYAYSFDDVTAGSEKEVFFTMQMPHAWDAGAIGIHVHWIGAVADTTAAPRWGLEYAWKEPGAVFGDTTIVYSVSKNPAEADITALKHYITDFTAITPDSTQDGLSSILVCRLFRNSSDAADTYNAAGAKCGLLYIDAHYQLNSLGSTDEYTK